MEEKNLTDIVREAQREYHRQWRQKNPDKVRAKNQRFWEKKAMELMKQREDGEGEH